MADENNHAIRKIDISTAVVTTVAGGGSQGYLDGQGTEAQLDTPMGVAVDVFGQVYVTDMGNNCIRMINTTGFVSTIAGLGTDGSGHVDGNGVQARFTAPEGIAIDANGTIYVSDGRLRKIVRLPTAAAPTTTTTPVPGSVSTTVAVASTSPQPPAPPEESDYAEYNVSTIIGVPSSVGIALDAR